jgi:ABC-type nitrate/sulfonate/bicarbonate transport system ATPase subunit
MPTDVLTVDDVSYGFVPDHPLFEGATLRLAAGRSLALVGPSGVGKSTLLRICAGLISPWRGTVQPPPAHEVAWVHQTTNVFPTRSVADNIRVAQLAVGVEGAAADDRAGRALERVGLADRAGQRARTLSGGERQRLCIARALATDPACVYADEPTGQLDRVTSESIADTLLGLTESGASLLLVTHDLDFAARCDDVLDLGHA